MFNNKEDYINSSELEFTSPNIGTYLMEAADEINLIMTLFIENDNYDVLNETISIKSIFINMVDRIISYISNLSDKLIASMDIRIRDTQINIDKYRESIMGLSDLEISEVEYDKMEFSIPKLISIKPDLPLVVKGISELKEGDITNKDISELKSSSNANASIIRGKLLGLNKPISEKDFDKELSRAFIYINKPSKVVLTKKDLLKMMDNIKIYSKYKKDIINTKVSVMGILKKYQKLISDIYEIEISHRGDPSSISSKIHANRLIEYQSILANYMATICDIYSRIFSESLKAIKSKLDYEQSVIRQTIKLLNTKR